MSAILPSLFPAVSFNITKKNLMVTMLEPFPLTPDGSSWDAAMQAALLHSLGPPHTCNFPPEALAVLGGVNGSVTPAQWLMTCLLPAQLW